MFVWWCALCVWKIFIRDADCIIFLGDFMVADFEIGVRQWQWHVKFHFIEYAICGSAFLKLATQFSDCLFSRLEWEYTYEAHIRILDTTNTPTPLIIWENHIIQCNYMCWCRTRHMLYTGTRLIWEAYVLHIHTSNRSYDF